jgi:hypothetical protein
MSSRQDRVWAKTTTRHMRGMHGCFCTVARGGHRDGGRAARARGFAPAENRSTTVACPGPPAAVPHRSKYFENENQNIFLDFEL